MKNKWNTKKNKMKINKLKLGLKKSNKFLKKIQTKIIRDTLMVILIKIF